MNLDASPLSCDSTSAYNLARTATETVSSLPPIDSSTTSGAEQGTKPTESEAAKDPAPEYTKDGRLITRHPYTIGECGRFIGHDGFVVPANFAEFFERFPSTVRDFCRATMRSGTRSEMSDRENDLLLHLMTLPEKSKFREPGYNGHPEGCADRIQTFNPDAAYGASYQHFQAYIYQCMKNRNLTLSKRHASNPIHRYNTLKLYSADDDGRMVDDEYLYVLCSQHTMAGKNFDEAITNGVFVSQFIDYVKEHNPEIVAVMEAFGSTDNLIGAQRSLGMNDKLFTRARNRLIYLQYCYDTGTTPIKQRRVYKDRAVAVTTKTTLMPTPAVQPETSVA